MDKSKIEECEELISLAEETGQPDEVITRLKRKLFELKLDAFEGSFTRPHLQTKFDTEGVIEAPQMSELEILSQPIPKQEEPAVFAKEVYSNGNTKLTMQSEGVAGNGFSQRDLDIINAYQSGTKVAEIEKKFNVPHNSFYNILKKARRLGIIKMSRMATEADIDDVISLYKEGKSVGDIATEKNWRYTRVYAILRRNGVI